MVVWLSLEWPDRRALVCDAEGAEHGWSSRAESVAGCLLERWTLLHHLSTSGLLLNASQSSWTGFAFFRFPSALPVPPLLPVQQLQPEPGTQHPAEQEGQGGDEQLRSFHLNTSDFLSTSHGPDLTLLLFLTALSRSELDSHFSPYDLKRLELYSRSMVDYHLIMDLIPVVSRMFFLKQLGNISISAAQCVGSLVRN